jgi:hypothetical protein
MTKQNRLGPRVLGGRALRSVALGGIAAGVLSLIGLASASAQTPQLVTAPDGSINYITPTYGSALVNTGTNVTYVNGNGTPTLVTSPNGSISYANVNGGPSLVYGPDGTLSYQNVITGSNGSSTTIGYSTPNGGTTSTTGNSSSTAQPVSAAAAEIARETAPYAIPMTTSQINGRYCQLPDGGGQIWVPAGAPSGDASCS